MVQGVSGKLSAYNNLPRELTRKVNINKTYKNARFAAEASRVTLAATGTAGMITLIGGDFVGFAFNMALHLLTIIISKDIRHNASKEMRNAYKEIVERAKTIYKK